MASCFNSQRDGILPKEKVQEAAAELEFQFPTGWNSTEFKKVELALIERFNSQRDGILLEVNFLGQKREVFQFPTGWNSTVF